MKLLVLLLSTLALNSVCLADSRDKDLNIDELRAEFVIAQTPFQKDMRIGERWSCISHTTASGAAKNSMVISFNKFQDQFHAILWENDNYLSPKALDFGLMNIIPTKGIYGSYSDARRIYVSYTLIRKTHKDDLLIEMAGDLVSDFNPSDEWKSRFESAPDAILGKSHKALYYAKCVSAE